METSRTHWLTTSATCVTRFFTAWLSRLGSKCSICLWVDKLHFISQISLDRMQQLVEGCLVLAIPTRWRSFIIHLSWWNIYNSFIMVEYWWQLNVGCLRPSNFWTWPMCTCFSSLLSCAISYHCREMSHEVPVIISHLSVLGKTATELCLCLQPEWNRKYYREVPGLREQLLAAIPSSLH